MVQMQRRMFPNDLFVSHDLPHFCPFPLAVIFVNYRHLCLSQLAQLSLCASPLCFPNLNHDALWASISGEWFSYCGCMWWILASCLAVLETWNCTQKWPQGKTSLLVVSIWYSEILIRCTLVRENVFFQGSVWCFVFNIMSLTSHFICVNLVYMVGGFINQGNG